MISVGPVTGPARVLAKFRVGRRARAAACLPFGPGASAPLRSWPRMVRFRPSSAGPLKGRPMNPADIAQSVAPLTSSTFAVPPVSGTPTGSSKSVMVGLWCARSGSGRSPSTRHFCSRAFARPASISNRHSGPASRWRNSTSRCRPSRSIRPARCSSPPCANGSAASRATPAPSPGCRCASRR